MSAAAWSPGWGASVRLGPGQEYARRRLLTVAGRHPSRTWHDAPRMREYGRSPGTAHRLIHRLAALGVVAVQTTLGAAGGVRFTFGVRLWHRGPVHRGQLRRFTGPELAPGQLAFMPPEDDEPEEPAGAAPPAPLPDPFSVGAPPAPVRTPTPQATDSHINPPAGWRAPSPLPPPAPDESDLSDFARRMLRYGFDPVVFTRRDDGRRRR